ncbi:helix-turn-helix transcriptional regulator [Candidatus Saccharibacteria bacterium]|nr:helix-turn-helix transcriptional regulator [Candidatus Saccharibacteria bacterium]
MGGTLTKVRSLRKEQGLTQVELAKASGISSITIIRMEMDPTKRRGGISIASACAVARTLGVELDVLFPNTVLNHTQGRPIQSGAEMTLTGPIQIIATCPRCGTQVSNRERAAGSSECCEATLAA